jgi:hypothetical protein
LKAQFLVQRQPHDCARGLPDVAHRLTRSQAGRLMSACGPSKARASGTSAGC